MKAILIALLIILNGFYSTAQQYDWSRVEEVFGKKGTVQNGIFKITFPRYDLKVKVGEFPVEPGLALTTWIAFMNMNGTASMMGDMVLLDNEVEPVILKMVSSGLQVTAIHNHLIGELPAVKYIHYSGSGDAVKLAEAIRSVLAITGTPFTTMKGTSQQVMPDWSTVESIMGKPGNHNGKLLQYSFPRKESLTENGMELPAYMGAATVVNFQMEPNQAAVAGDFVLMADEVNPVVKSLTENGISVTALHNHMLYDNPRLFMIHFWGVNDPVKLAQGVKEALLKTNSEFK